MAAPTAEVDADIWERITALAAGRLVIPQTEVCRALGITTDTLNAEIEAGRLRYVLVGSRKKFKPSDLAHYLQHQERGPCVENLSSYNDRGGPVGIATFASEVVDFATALARTPATKPKRSPPSYTPLPRLVETRPLRRPRLSRSGKRSVATGKPAARTSEPPATLNDTAKR